MKKFLFSFSIFIFLSLFFTSPVYTWGFFAHKKIHYLAVQGLPEPLIGFYKKHIDFLTEHAVDPDKRRYIVESEGARHYIDYDHYDTLKTFQAIPHAWKAAVAKFTEDTLKANGILPWNILWVMKNLENAFCEKDMEEILLLSADLGHYIADAHVPLHTTHNYNGQYTGQHGIHGFWESRLPEIWSDEYDFFVGKADYIKNPSEYIWNVIKESHLAVDSVLLLERALHKNFPSDKKYSFENRGRGVVRTYSRDYSEKYNQLLNGMVERRMRKAVYTVSSFWFTCWKNAGEPMLTDSLTEEVTESLQQSLKLLNDAYYQNSIKGRDHED